MTVPNDAFKEQLGKFGMPPAAQEELLQNMRLVYEFGYYGGEKLDWSQSVSSLHFAAQRASTDVLPARRRAAHNVGGVHQGKPCVLEGAA